MGRRCATGCISILGATAPSPPKGADHAGTVRFGAARESDNRSRADAEIAGFQGIGILGFLVLLHGGETVIKAARGLHVITNSRVVAELALYRIVGQQDE